MVALLVNGKKIIAPVSWEEMDTATFQRLFSLGGDNELLPIKVFCALTDTNFDVILETEHDELETSIYQWTAFVFNSPQEFRNKELPAKFTFKKKAYAIPKKISALSVGQNFYLRQALAMRGKNLESSISIATAVFMQPIIDGQKFDVDRALEIEQEILKMPIYATFPIGFFLLTRLVNTGRNGMISWLQRKAKETIAALSWKKLRAFVNSTHSMNFQ